MVVNLFFFYYFSFVAAAWFFSSYPFTSTMVHYKLLMVTFEGVGKLESMLSVFNGNEIVSVCSFLDHSRTQGSNELR